MDMEEASGTLQASSIIEGGPGGVITTLPDDQWVQEITHWESTIWQVCR